jgi:phosphatidylglycerophosphate synthase
MPDETKNDDAMQSPEIGEQKVAEPKVLIRGSDITAVFFGGIIFLTVISVGLMNVLAATGKYNPMHWKGRFWTGMFMLAVPSAMGILPTLPKRLLSKIPESVLGVTIILLWVAFFWATCGGH